MKGLGDVQASPEDRFACKLELHSATRGATRAAEHARTERPLARGEETSTGPFAGGLCDNPPSPTHTASQSQAHSRDLDGIPARNK